MRLIAWNLGHQTRERPIHPRFIDALTALEPDVLALNEYVDGPSRSALRETLACIGLCCTNVSARLGTNNQALIASRWTIERGDLNGPETIDGGGVSNFLHVVNSDPAIEIVAVRAPAYENAAILRDYWRKLSDLIESTKARRIVYAGDLNTDPDATRHWSATFLRNLRSAGWSIPSPSGPWSYISGTRIDHVIASPSVTLLGARYVSELGGIQLASTDGSSRISDHAALVVDLDVTS